MTPPPRRVVRRKKAAATENRDRGLAAAIVSSLADKYGEGAAQVFSERDFIQGAVTGYISTGCYAINRIIQQDGIPLGRLTTIVGEEGSGKSTMAAHIMAEVQKMGGLVVLADAENAFDPDRAPALGVDASQVVWLRSTSLQETINEIIDTIGLIREEAADIPVAIIWDSISQTPPQEELDDPFGTVHMALHSRYVSAAMRRLIPLIASTKVALIFVNQYRENIGVKFGSKKIMLAARPIRFASTVIFELTRMGKVGNKKEPSGIEVKVYTYKNKVGKPFRTAIVDLLFGGKPGEPAGWDNPASILNAAVGAGIVKKGASGYFKYDGWDGSFRKAKFGDVLEAHPEILEWLDTTDAPKEEHDDIEDLVGEAEADDE
jgi:recombination protein RecA